VKHWPALDVRSAVDSDLLLAALDDFSPTAIDERDGRLRAFFSSAAARDRAASALHDRFHVAALEVPDEDWARRSQQDITPVVVGRITVAPPWMAPHGRATQEAFDHSGNGDAHVVVIAPSMGFGTGHHETTRLCLAALQKIDLRGASVLDVGTGSGVLAIAAVLLGASHAVGIDSDADAIQSARENLDLNPPFVRDRITFSVADFTPMTVRPARVVVANLTGAVLVRAAGNLAKATEPGGTLIVSGLLTEERHEVLEALSAFALTDEAEEHEWAALTLTRPIASTF